MENTTQTITTETKLFFGTPENKGVDFDKIKAYYEEQPDFRILEFCDKFWLQNKLFNYQDIYEKIEDCRYYDGIVSPFISKEGFFTLEDAQEAYLCYRTKAVVHPVPLTPGEIEKANAAK